ncbi:MAG: MFS transporter [Candidatus Lokiarchaeota archaeon]|nr:MFS transporter [Candidatus Lokiarchaeota archaeon]
MSENHAPAQTRTLVGWRLVLFAMGTLGQMAPIGFFSTYITTFYNYTVKLNPTITFIGLFFGLTTFAVMAPIFGTIIDNKRPGRLGKRKPFLLLGIPLIVVLMIIAWMPPMCPIGDPNYPPTAIYYLIVTILVFMNQALLVSTYLSMLAEQSTEVDNRVKIATLQGIFSIIGTILSILIPIILESKIPNKNEPEWYTPSGQYLTSTLPVYGIIFGVAGAIAFIAAFAASDESFYAKMAVKDQPRASIGKTFAQIVAPFSDKNYRYWLGNAFFFNMAIRILIVILIPIMRYVLDLEQNQNVWFFLAIIPFALGGYVLWARKIKRSGLKASYGMSLLVNVIFAFVAIIFVIDMPFEIKFVLGAIVLGILISSLVGGYLFPNPIVSTLVDRAPTEMRQKADALGRGLSGSYFGLYIFFYNISQALTNILLLFILPEERLKDPFFILLTIPVAGILVLFSYLFLRRLDLPHKN